MVRKNRNSGSDQRFNSHSNLFSYLSPPATRNLCYPAPPSAIHARNKLNKFVGKVTTTLNTVLPNIQAMTLLWPSPSPLWTHRNIALYPLTNEAGTKDSISYSCPNAPSLSECHVTSHEDIISTFSNSWVHIPDTRLGYFTFCPDIKRQDSY